MSYRSLKAFLQLLSLLLFFPIRYAQAQSEEDEANFFHFVTRPDIDAPKFDLKVYDESALSPGYWFLAPYEELHQTEQSRKWVGAHIYDGSGQLIWSGAPMYNYFNSFDFRTVTVGGEQMISLIETHGNTGQILDSGYQVHNTVKPKGGVNMHDFNVFQDGERALVLYRDGGPASLEASRKVGFEGQCKIGSDGIHEVDVSTGEILFEWKARDHIGLEETTFKNKTAQENCGNGWDIHHFNAIDKFPDGHYLLSSRHTDTLYKIAPNGDIVWRFGGVKSDIVFDGIFSRQHHARVQSQNSTHEIITVFDNAVGTGPDEHRTNEVSRGLVIAIRNDTTPVTATILKEYKHPRNAMTNSRGSFEFLPNGNAYICWTYGSLVSEHLPDGTLIMEANLKPWKHTYRSYKFPWVGRPAQPPDVLSKAIDVTDGGVKTAVYVSWNGATEVATWNLYKTTEQGRSAERIASTARHGFETLLTYDGFASYVVVEALDREGQSLGKSNVTTTITPSNKFSPAVVEETQWLQDHSSSSAEAADNSEWMEKAGTVVSNPLVTYAFGFLSCAAIVAIFWAFLRWRRRDVSWMREKSQLYEPLRSEEGNGMATNRTIN